ncbi:MAG TPA: MraY family glycosyltransferase [Rugosimonospora sp.]|nr:MraY family glycosyltransferase [Rugosimonospora sp.]
MSPLVLALLVAVLALPVSALLCEAARRIARRYELTDRPGPHKAHPTAIPYLGGVAVAAVTLVPLAVVPGAPPWLWQLAGAALLVAILGLVDDVRGLSAGTRLAVEAVLAGWLVAAGFRLGLPVPSSVDAALTVVAVVVLTNSFNLLDNTDGALATVVCGTCGPLALSAFLGGRGSLGVLLACLGCAATGFLLHNAPPARIFLGDAGSLFAGFLIVAGAAAVPSGSGGGTGRIAFLLLVVFVPVLDTGLVLVSRIRHRQPWWQGGTDHLAHRLRRAGLGPYPVLAVLLVLAVAGSVLAALVNAALLPGTALLAGTVAALACGVAVLLRIPGYPAPAEPGVPAGLPAARRPPARHARTTSRG